MNTNGVTNIVFAGVGGQGVLKASDIAAEVLFKQGYDVKKAEVHGMSQRGGSVTSDIRFGERVLSPLVPLGEAHYVVVLEPSETEAVRDRLRSDGVMLLVDSLQGVELPSPRTVNIAMLGMLSRRLDVPREAWISAVCAALPLRHHAINVEAFEIGATTLT